MEKLFTQSENFKSEYCCTVVKIGELTPIEGSDFLAKTDILGTQIVVRKDQVSEGQVMFYSSNETALNEKFLSVNNLFEIGSREKNVNYPEVKAIMDEYDEKYRKEADSLREQAKQIKSKINSFTANASRLNKQIKKLNEELDNINSGKIIPEANRVEEIKQEVEKKQNKADESSSKAVKLTVEYTNTKKRIEELVEAGKPIVEHAKKSCGFFNKYGRVRCITLKGEPSFGFVFGIDEMARFCPEANNINLEDYLDEDFDTVNGELFVKAFVPPIKPEQRRGSKENKANKKLNQFDRLVEGEFAFHYETSQLTRNIHLLSPESNVVISVKRHGTSVIFAKLHVKEPKRIAPHKWLWNKFVDLTGLFKSTRFIDYNIVYGPVFSSRKVIKNRYINESVNSGYYSQDIWSEYGNIIYPYLDEGMSVYGEICGYITGTQQMIQKFYDYGCAEGENNIMFYRISTINEDGTKREWEVQEVYDWTVQLIERMKEAGDENWKRVQPIDILYQGTLLDLYPDIDPSEHWHEEVLKRMKNDKEHFGMDELEPLCTHYESPREGFCLRIVNDPILECFKLKSVSFSLKESVMMDSGEVDMEMLDNYGDIAQNNETTTTTNEQN